MRQRHKYNNNKNILWIGKQREQRKNQRKQKVKFSKLKINKKKCHLDLYLFQGHCNAGCTLIGKGERENRKKKKSNQKHRLTWKFRIVTKKKYMHHSIFILWNEKKKKWIHEAYEFKRKFNNALIEKNRTRIWMCTRQWCKLCENRIRENIFRSPRVDRCLALYQSNVPYEMYVAISHHTVTHIHTVHIDNGKSCKRVLDRGKSLVLWPKNDLCSIHLHRINIQYSGKLDIERMNQRERKSDKRKSNHMWTAYAWLYARVHWKLQLVSADSSEWQPPFLPLARSMHYKSVNSTCLLFWQVNICFCLWPTLIVWPQMLL